MAFNAGLLSNAGTLLEDDPLKSYLEPNDWAMMNKPAPVQAPPAAVQVMDASPWQSENSMRQLVQQYAPPPQDHAHKALAAFSKPASPSPPPPRKPSSPERRGESPTQRTQSPKQRTQSPKPRAQSPERSGRDHSHDRSGQSWQTHSSSPSQGRRKPPAPPARGKRRNSPDRRN